MTLGRFGIRPFVRGDETPGGFEYVWSNLLFDGEDLLGLPAAADLPPVPCTPQPSFDDEGRRGRGRPVKHDWEAFNRKVVERLTLDGGNLTRKELVDYMKFWVIDGIPTDIADRTVERGVAALLSPGLIPD